MGVRLGQLQTGSVLLGSRAFEHRGVEKDTVEIQDDHKHTP
jgi:hypothetical protein